FGVGFIEKLYGDSGKGPGSRVFQHVKEREIKQDPPLAEHPRPWGHWWLTCGKKSRDGSPQTLRCRTFLRPCNLDEEDTQRRSEESMPEPVNHGIVIPATQPPLDALDNVSSTGEILPLVSLKEKFIPTIANSSSIVEGFNQD
ncbi:MAG TPA: hypothetical protein VFX10_04220, partial [Nitrospira sp.]|nr:hypothetical protein [Nitrospira sp.]